jgi:hypothetical protein
MSLTHTVGQRAGRYHEGRRECIVTTHAHALFFFLRVAHAKFIYTVVVRGAGKHVSKGNQAVGAPLDRFPSIFLKLDPVSPTTCWRARDDDPFHVPPSQLFILR